LSSSLSFDVFRYPPLTAPPPKLDHVSPHKLPYCPPLFPFLRTSFFFPFFLPVVSRYPTSPLLLDFFFSSPLIYPFFSPWSPNPPTKGPISQDCTLRNAHTLPTFFSFYYPPFSFFRAHISPPLSFCFAPKHFG